MNIKARYVTCDMMVDAGSNNHNNLKGAMFEMYCNLHGLKYLQVYYKYREEEEWGGGF